MNEVLVFYFCICVLIVFLTDPTVLPPSWWRQAEHWNPLAPQTEWPECASGGNRFTSPTLALKWEESFRQDPRPCSELRRSC